MSVLEILLPAAALLAALASAAIAWRAVERIATLERLLEDREGRRAALDETLGAELGALRADGEERTRALDRLSLTIERLAADMANRESWGGEAPAHASAIDAARAGRGSGFLVREHGLSTDEAELIVSLHGRAPATAEG